MSTFQNFYSLIHAIAATQTEAQLRSQFRVGAGDIFEATAWGIVLQNSLTGGKELEATGVPEIFLTRYQELDRGEDPIAKFVIEHHAPAHQQQVIAVKDWRRSALYQHVFAPYGLQHVMKAPIVGRGQLIGTIQFSRGGELPPFTTNELAILSGLCAHLSAQVAVLRSDFISLNSALVLRLTQRERQIADLVAQGLTNIEIGAVLRIAPSSVKQALRRMFRKLSVSSRTQMVSKLQRNPLAIE
jgi:DNA-binding CsgD family transcriptional regulator